MTVRPAVICSESSREASASGEPLVTVVITSYNHGKYIAEAIDSVLKQTWPRVEIIIVDDGSTDDTPKVIARYPQIFSIRQTNQGVSVARNTGLRASHGRYVLFLDSDDFLTPRAIESAVQAFEGHPEFGFVSGAYCETDSEGKPKGKPFYRKISNEPYIELLRWNYIAMHATVLYRRDVLEQVGGFDPSLRTCEDCDVYLKIARQYPVGKFQELMAYYRHHGSNTSRETRHMLSGAFNVMKRQRPFLKGDQMRQMAYHAGMRHWHMVYAPQVLQQSLDRLRQPKNFPGGIAGMTFLLLHSPVWLGKSLAKRLLHKIGLRKER